MTSDQVLNDLTRLYTSKVARIIKYKKMLAMLNGDQKTKDILEHLIMQEKDSINSLGTITLGVLDEVEPMPQKNKTIPGISIEKHLQESFAGLNPPHIEPPIIQQDKESNKAQFNISLPDISQEDTHIQQKEIVQNHKKTKHLVWKFGR